MTSEPVQDADTVWDQRQAEAAQRSVERFRQTAAELRTQAQSFDDLATEWEKRVAFYSEQIDGCPNSQQEGDSVGSRATAEHCCGVQGNGPKNPRNLGVVHQRNEKD